LFDFGKVVSGNVQKSVPHD